MGNAGFCPSTVLLGQGLWFRVKAVLLPLRRKRTTATTKSMTTSNRSPHTQAQTHTACICKQFASSLGVLVQSDPNNSKFSTCSTFYVALKPETLRRKALPQPNIEVGAFSKSTSM